MSKEKVGEAIENKVQEVAGKQTLTCQQAFEVSKETGAKLSDVGRVCNEKKIKITGCQLGCFK